MTDHDDLAPDMNPLPEGHLGGKHRLLVREARSWVGKAREMGGNNRGQIVEMFQRSVSEHVVGLAWCLSFLWYCIKEAQTQADAYAACFSEPSPLPVTAGCMDLWHRADRSMRLPRPEVGSILILQLWENGRPTVLGHACLVTEVLAGDLVRTVDGNAAGADSPQAQREGDTVREKTRHWRAVNNAEAGLIPLGFLRVWRE